MDCDLCDFFDCFERLFLFVLRVPPVRLKGFIFLVIL